MIYFAHDGIDHSTGAVHETSRDGVNSASIFIGVTLVAGILLVGTFMLVKKRLLPKSKEKN
jgi:hypothetical protein